MTLLLASVFVGRNPMNPDEIEAENALLEQIIDALESDIQELERELEDNED